jgi:hypothetical protein
MSRNFEWDMKFWLNKAIREGDLVNVFNNKRKRFVDAYTSVNYSFKYSADYLCCGSKNDWKTSISVPSLKDYKIRLSINRIQST